MQRNRSTVLILISLVLAFLPTASEGSDMSLDSSTYLHLYQVDTVTGPDRDIANLYEYLSLDIWETGRPELSVHLYGWGRTELRDEADPDADSGHLSSAHLLYRSSDGRNRARFGRMLLTEGTAMEALDGLHFRTTFGRTGVSFFGGVPEEGEASAGDRGDTLAGARGYLVIPGLAEVGLNYLQEDGDFSGDDRREAGGDLWLRPFPTLEITGRALYNLSTSGLASDELALSLDISPRVQVMLASEGYTYEDLFQTTTNPAFLSTNLRPSDEVRITRGSITWNPMGSVGLRGSYRSTDHRESDPGDSTRTEVGIDLRGAPYVERIGLRMASQKGDLPENEYSEVRAYCMASAGSFLWSIDALALTYEENIGGEDRTTQFLGSAGWRLSERLEVTGNLRLTKSPVLEEDLAAILRLRYAFGNQSGVN